MSFLYVSFVDPCKEKLCEFYRKCMKGNDGKATCVCPVCDSKEKYSPVCSDNGKTYASQCELEKEACVQNSDIKMAKKEACGRCQYCFHISDVMFFHYSAIQVIQNISH